MPTMRASAQALFEKADLNKDGTLELKEFEPLMEQARKDFPHLEAYLGETSKASIDAMYDRFSSISSNQTLGITPEDFEAGLALVDKELKMLPPTAQVATQQGIYLAKVLNNVPYEELGHGPGFESTFEYKHQGSLAYIGGEHAAIDSPIFGAQSGILVYCLWKAIYFGSSVSWKMRIGLCFDWAKSWFLGRDTSRL